MPPKRPRRSHQKHALYQTVLDFDAPPPVLECKPQPRPATVEEATPSATAYCVKAGYRNPYGRAVDWVIYNPHGTALATVTTKAGAEKIARLLDAPPETEPGSPYALGEGWRTTADNKLRHWIIYNPDSTALATVKSKRGAETILRLLNRQAGQER